MNINKTIDKTNNQIKNINNKNANQDKEIETLKTLLDEKIKEIDAIKETLTNKGTDIENLSKGINNLQDKVIQKGTVVFFDINTYSTLGGCPQGWTNISSGKTGKYIMLDSNKNAGNVNDAYFPNHWHGVGAFDQDINNDMLFYARNHQSNNIGINGNGFYKMWGDAYNNSENKGAENYKFEDTLWNQVVSTRPAAKGIGTTSDIYTGNSNTATVATNKIEVKPASLSVIACRKD